MTDYRPQNVINQLLTVVKIFLTHFSRHRSSYKRKKWLIRKFDYLALVINVLNTVIDAVIQVLFQEINWPLARIFVSAVINVAILIYLLTLHFSLRISHYLFTHSKTIYIAYITFLVFGIRRCQIAKLITQIKVKLGPKWLPNYLNHHRPVGFHFPNLTDLEWWMIIWEPVW